MTMPKDAIKNSGQVFTPQSLVRMMLDHCGYRGAHILRQHLIDNSCGEGAFLCEAVERYCTAAHAEGISPSRLKVELENYIHGIEILPDTHRKCLENLNAVAARFQITDVRWDVRCSDALPLTDYDARMDYVVGNPPYVRVHNLEDTYDSVKKFSFAGAGMTDLYLVFFELGFRMLAPKGKLIYVTPSSWLTSLAGTSLRQYILYRRTLRSIIDFGHRQLFGKATTYVLVAFFDHAEPQDHLEALTYNPVSGCTERIDTLTYDDIAIGKNFYIGKKEALRILRQTKEHSGLPYVKCKNGFATLSDKIFIGELPFEDFVIPVIKGSTGEWKKALFPYDTKGQPVNKEELFSHPPIADYLGLHKNELLKGKTEETHPTWYLYGRSQALKDVWKDKIVINTLVKDASSVKVNRCPKGSGVYSGLYILTDETYEIIRDLLCSDDFIAYVSLLRNYKSGGYYTFNTKDVEQFLNHKISLLPKEQRHNSHDQRKLHQGYLDFLQ